MANICSKTVQVAAYSLANDRPLVLIAGPCVIEGESFALQTAAALRKIAASVGMSLIYKSSFDKANRTSLRGFRGFGVEEGLRILQQVREQIGIPVVTDVHNAAQAVAAADVVDLLQTPAFLCRQTDFIQDVAATGKPVNLKKGQFLAPQDMVFVAEKAAATGNDQLLLCERGTMFGYRDLVVDMRSLSIMAETGYPVVFDATHSVQHPGGGGGKSSGERRFVPTLARAAVATGIAALFFEVHPDPDQAPCDGANMLPMAWLPELLCLLKKMDETVKTQ